LNYINATSAEYAFLARGTLARKAQTDPRDASIIGGQEVSQEIFRSSLQIASLPEKELLQIGNANPSERGHAQLM